MDNIDYVNAYVVYIIHGWTYCHATNLHAVSVGDDWLNNFIIGDSLCKMRAEEVATEHSHATYLCAYSYPLYPFQRRCEVFWSDTASAEGNT